MEVTNFMTDMPVAIKFVLLLLVGMAAAFDLRFRRIPNWLAILGLLLGFALNSLLYGWRGIGVAGSGFALGFGVYFVLYLLHAMGAGDAKLMAAIGSMVGAANWFGIFVFTAVIGAVLGVLLLVSKRRLQSCLWNVFYIISEMVRFRPPYWKHPGLDVRNPEAVTLPHGFTIAVGCLAFLVAGRAVLG